jgi:hypothetical protein
MGESHEQGLERDYIAQLYSDMATVLKPDPVQCLVESGSSSDGNGGPAVSISLIPLSGDPLMPQFLKVCAQNLIWVNPLETHDDYTDKLKKFLPQGRVLTHTGARHTLPFGLIYPQDFPSPQWVDVPAHGTINRQVPKSFIVSNQQMRSHANWGVDDMLFPQLQSQMQQALKKKTDPAQVAQAAGDEVTRLMSSPALQFAPGEVSHVFQMNRVTSSFPFQKAYVSLLNHTAFNPELLKTLLAAPETTQFLKEVDPASLSVQIFEPTTPDASYGIGASTSISENGTIFLFGNVAGKSKNPQIALVMITPTQAVKLVHVDASVALKLVKSSTRIQ